MSAMTHFTLRSLARNRVRTGVTIAGVALAAALLTGVLSCVTSLNAFLYENEVAVNGLWSASAWVQDDATIENVEQSEHVTGVAVMRDAGFVALDAQTQSLHGTYLPLLSTRGDVERLCAVHADEGRLPENAGEIMLPASWKGETCFGGTPLELGSTVTFDVGKRVVVAADAAGVDEDVADRAGEEEAPDQATEANAGGYPARAGESEVHAGDVVGSDFAYLGAASDGNAFCEELEGIATRTYEVVGFYTSANIATMTSISAAGITTGDVDASLPYNAKAYVTATGFSTQDEMLEALSDAFGSDYVTLHNAVLNYAGITDSRAVWDTMFNLVIILAAVIVIACVSLIYNAFAISVAERTRQFGLLVSIGASPRQIRGAIVFEALVIALIGVPLGLLAGIGGTALVLALIGPSVADLYGAANGVTLDVSVDPAAILFAATLTLATVLISVWIPARRAANVSAVDAIRRTQDVRPARKRASRRGASADADDAPASLAPAPASLGIAPDATGGVSQPAAKRNLASRLWKPGGFGIERAFGVPGYIARANRKRGRAKGGAASVSLALAIVLLMTAGSLSATLGSLTDAATYDYATSDLTFSSHTGNQGDVAAQIKGYEDIYTALLNGADVQACGRGYYTSATALIPQNMAGAALRASELPASEPSASQALLDDGSIVAMCNFVFLPDEDFRAYAQSIGAQADQFFEGKNRAIAITGAFGNNGITYTYRENIAAPGTVERVAGAESNGEPVAFLTFQTSYLSAEESESGEEALAVTCAGSMVDELGTVTEDVPFEELEVDTVPFEVVALADEQPEASTLSSDLPAFIMPLSAATSVLDNGDDGQTAADAEKPLSAGDQADESKPTDAEESSDAEETASAQDEFNFFSPYLSMTALFDAADHAQAAADLERAAEEAGAHSYTDSYLGGYVFFVSDNVASSEQNDILIAIINLFTLLFTGILALIAMANVFNTVTNGLILRRREFAVMRSVGMGNRAFRRMIACECIGYGIRGLIPGVIISTLVSYLLYDAMAESIQGMTFTLPWAHIGIAIALVVLIMGASVAYGLRRCRTDSIVDALRDDVA